MLVDRNADFVLLSALICLYYGIFSLKQLIFALYLYKRTKIADTLGMLSFQRSSTNFAK